MPFEDLEMHMCETGHCLNMEKIMAGNHMLINKK